MAITKILPAQKCDMCGGLVPCYVDRTYVNGKLCDITAFCAHLIPGSVMPCPSGCKEVTPP